MDPLARRLLAWYARHSRDLPWRKTRDAYRIFVSELMLQQTQVDRVILKYRAFLKRFPSWKRLAEAPAAELVHAWAGLGYNRRALYARDAARQVIADGLPRTEDEWKLLKGVGPYMAAALSEFADHRRAIVLDTNIRRVAGRSALGILFPTLRDDVRIRRVLERLTPTRGAHWDFPQALMDLANEICLPRTPACAVCPLRAQCKASKRFLAGNVRQPKRHRATERIHAEKRSPDRIYRGRILAWVRAHGPTRIAALGHAIDGTFDPIADQDWVRAMCERLVKDGLLTTGRGDIVSLPNS